jgi:hypothetical protein
MASGIAYASMPSVNSTLLRLVPSGAQLVSGFSEPGQPVRNARLALVTAENNLDLSDCIALLGVDGEERIVQVVTVAQSSGRKELNDHLLLLEGHFNQALIFKSAIENGAKRNMQNGVEIVEIQPFSRESNRGLRERWMAILNDKVLVFGTPRLVAEALDRYQQHQPGDPVLLERKARLPANVHKWILVALRPSLMNSESEALPFPSFIRGVFGRSDELELGLHYGHGIRAFFAAHIPDESVAKELAVPQSPHRINCPGGGWAYFQPGPDGSGYIYGSTVLRSKELEQLSDAFGPKAVGALTQKP